MLVLTRYQGQSLVIGTGIRVTVLKSVRGHVELGIEAPRDVHIVREELRTVPLVADSVKARNV